MLHQGNQSGFTLIEMIVYIAVLMIISTAVITTFISFNGTLSQLKVERMVTDSASRVLERFERDVRGADGVDIVLSEFAVADSTIVLNNLESDDITYSLVSEQIYISDESGLNSPLTGNDVAVSDMYAYWYVGSTTEMIRLMFTVQATSGKATANETFYTGAVLRGSYE